jgi:hypothetical protein
MECATLNDVRYQRGAKMQASPKGRLRKERDEVKQGAILGVTALGIFVL